MNPLKFSIFDEFRCAGQDCPETCCNASIWNASVDDSTLDRWQRIEDARIKSSLMDSIIEAKAQVGNGSHHLKRNNQDNCVHLTRDGLCWVQSNLGHEYLPRTCAEYPRRYWMDEYIGYISLVLSCPEVVRTLFTEYLNKECLTKEPDDKNKAPKREISINISLSEELFKLTTEVTESSKYTVNLMLLYIGEVLYDIVSLPQQGQLDMNSLKSLCSNSKQKMHKMNKAINENKMSAEPIITGQFWEMVYSFVVDAGMLLPSYSEAFRDELLDILSVDIKGESIFIEISELADQYRSAMYENLPKDYHKMMRNYIRVKFLNALFPWNPHEGNVIAGFIYCLIPYSLIQLLMWVQYRQSGKFDINDLVTIVCRVERRLGHSKTIYKTISKNQQLLQLDRYLKSLIKA